MNVAATAFLAFWFGAVAGLVLTVIAGSLLERFNSRANRRIERLLADFDGARPQFNEDNPKWSQK